MIRFLPYLLAHFAKSQLWHASTLLFAFFLTEHCGLRPVDTGWIMGSSLVANGIADLAIGYHWRTQVVSVGSASRMQAAFAPVSAAFFVLFCATVLAPVSVRPGWALAMILGFRLSYPLLDVPQNTIVALLARSPGDQRWLLACRNVTSQVANLAVSLAGAQLLFGGTHGVTFVMWACLVAMLSPAAAILLARIGSVEDNATAGALPARAVPAYETLVVILATMVLAGAAFRMMVPYFAAFALPSVRFLFWAAAGALVAQPLWLVTIRRVGRSTGMAGIAGLLAASSLLLLTPLRGIPGVGAAIALSYGTGTGALWLVLWSAMTAHASRGDAIRRVSGFTCISKLSQGFAAVLVGHLLQQTEYRETLSDPLSSGSLLMAFALLAIMACCAWFAVFGTRRLRCV